MKPTKETNILLVEDERVAYQSIMHTLENHGYSCEGAASIKEARERLKRSALDLVICDISLPDGSGLDLLKDARNYLLDTPFVMITASERKSLIQDAIRFGANDFLTKPFHLDNLPTIVERNLVRTKISRMHNRQQKVSVLIRTIQALIAALEAKDSYTSGHSMRVARHARLVGEALHLSDDELFTLELSALLHDIGKIGMPDSILNKTSSLEEMEYNTAKEHPVVGSRIVGKIEELQEVSANIRHHHERFDGNGYPDGLAGKAIPLFARILSIVDAYESIVSARTYHASQSREKALTELEQHSGTQFDPELVAIFTRLMRSKDAQRVPRLQIENELADDMEDGTKQSQL